MSACCASAADVGMMNKDCAACYGLQTFPCLAQSSQALAEIWVEVFQALRHLLKIMINLMTYRSLFQCAGSRACQLCIRFLEAHELTETSVRTLPGQGTHKGDIGMQGTKQMS